MAKVVQLIIGYSAWNFLSLFLLQGGDGEWGGGGGGQVTLGEKREPFTSFFGRRRRSSSMCVLQDGRKIYLTTNALWSIVWIFAEDKVAHHVFNELIGAEEKDSPWA